MGEGLRRIAQVLRVLGWLWLALFVVLACVFGYGRERDLTRDEQIALYERQTQKKLTSDPRSGESSAAPQSAQRLRIDKWANVPTPRKFTVTTPDGSTYQLDGPDGVSGGAVIDLVRDQLLANHFKGKTPTTRDREWFAAVACVVGGLVGFGIAFALAWIVNGFTVDKSKR